MQLQTLPSSLLLHFSLVLKRKQEAILITFILAKQYQYNGHEMVLE
jgi:hypothetical protein